jgi:Kef-type K+ transport system membrane component KefB
VIATVPPPDIGSIVLVLAATTVAAILSRVHSRLILPSIVVEIVLGILIGPEVLAWASVDSYLAFLSNFGLVFLFFFAGLEVVEQQVSGRSLARGSLGWLISLGIGMLAGVVLQAADLDSEGWIVGVALSTTALGTIVPILGDAGMTRTPLGSAVLGTGVAGEFWPIVVISMFLTGIYGAKEEFILLLIFCLVVALIAIAAVRVRPPRIVRVLQQTVHTTGQAAVRLAVLVLAALVLLANDAGFDFVLGAFAGGLIVGLALRGHAAEPVQMRLEGIGFGFLIPIYFVVTGMNFDIDSLLTPRGLGLTALFLGLLFVTRGASSVLWWRSLGRRSTLSLALFGATGLPLIVAIVGIGIDRDAITAQVGASIIGAGMISVLAFPLTATAVAGWRPELAEERHEDEEF